MTPATVIAARAGIAVAILIVALGAALAAIRAGEATRKNRESIIHLCAVQHRQLAIVETLGVVLKTTVDRDLVITGFPTVDATRLRELRVYRQLLPGLRAVSTEIHNDKSCF